MGGLTGRRSSLVAAACVLCAASSLLAQAAPLAAFKPAAYSVAIVAFEKTEGLTAPPATPCMNPTFPNSCLPIVHAEEEKVLIEYGPLPNQPVPAGATVNIVACYSNSSSFNRPWRANTAKADVLLDKACHFKIAAGKNAAAGGRVEFMPPEESPTSTVFIRAYVYAPGQQPFAVAQTQGFFQIVRIPTPSHAVKSAAIGMCFAGPVILAIALPLDTYLTKRRKHH